jgi:hypothetical protein
MMSRRRSAPAWWATLAAASALAACAPTPPPPPPDLDRPPPAGEIVGDAFETLDADAARQLDAAAMADIRAAGRSIVVRRSPSLPRMIQRPDGAWEAEQPLVVAAIRTGQGWLRLSAEGRQAFDGAAGAQLDRLFAAPGFWSGSVLEEAGCTDPGGIVLRALDGRRERASVQPCGLTGLTGQMAQIVLSGRITDWRDVPDAFRPAGLPIGRFTEPTTFSYGFSSGIDEERRLDIRTPEAWLAQWRRLTARHGPPAPPPSVDFSRHMVLLAAMGQRPTGGYQVVIDRVLEHADALEVHVRHISPGPRCGTTAALTQPADVVMIPASPKPVRWVVEEVVSDCP